MQEFIYHDLSRAEMKIIETCLLKAKLIGNLMKLLFSNTKNTDGLSVPKGIVILDTAKIFYGDIIDMGL